MSGLILPPEPSKPHKFAARTNERARFWHDYRYPGDVARAIVTAQRDGKPLPVPMPEHCPNPDCRVCNPDPEAMRKVERMKNARNN